jgi:hypothetical protein
MRAEGNGFIMTSSLVQGLGLMVSFSITGRSTFQSTRTIPCIEIKELSFGSVPSIFGGQLMNFGTKEDVTRTLRFVGCHPETITKYREHPSQSYSGKFDYGQPRKELALIYCSGLRNNCHARANLSSSWQQFQNDPESHY